MKKPQNAFDSGIAATVMKDLGERIRRLRIARRTPQGEAALRAGLARSTASRVENGDLSVAIGQVLRYVDAIAPGKTLAQLYGEEDSAVRMLEVSEKRTRARKIAPGERSDLDF